MQEMGVVFDKEGKPLYWHDPQGATCGSIPDSEPLWNFIWTHRDEVAGFAHTHPGGGVPNPSSTDLMTFSAMERALGKRLLWPIVTSEMHIVYEYLWVDDKHPCYDATRGMGSVHPLALMRTIHKLRRRSFRRSLREKIKGLFVDIANS